MSGIGTVTKVYRHTPAFLAHLSAELKTHRFPEQGML